MGKLGNTYHLDAIDKLIRLEKELSKNAEYQIESIRLTNNFDEAIQLISLAHTKKLITTLKTGSPLTNANSSGIMWQPALFNYVCEMAISAKKVVDESFKNKISLGLIGGGHHAEKNKSLGFCPLNNLAIAAIYASLKHCLKVAVIDLDVHYSNGCFDVLKEKNNIFCSSIWNKKIDKWKYYDSGKNIWHQKVNNSTEYFNKLTLLENKLINWKPQLILYHLALDVLSTDRMGGITGFTKVDLLKREKRINDLTKKLDIPYGIFLGGSYIDYSKGEKKAKLEKHSKTQLEIKALNYHTK